MAWQRVTLLKRRHGCIHRAAAVVAEHHDQLCSEHGGTKLQACQLFERYEVAGHTDHEQVAGTLVERQFWRNPGIRAAEDCGERRLALCAAGASCGEVALARLVRDIARIAFNQQVQRRIGRAGGRHVAAERVMV